MKTLQLIAEVIGWILLAGGTPFVFWLLIIIVGDIVRDLLFPKTVKKPAVTPTFHTDPPPCPVPPSLTAANLHQTLKRQKQNHWLPT